MALQKVFIIFVTIIFIIGIVHALQANPKNFENFTKELIGTNTMEKCPPGILSNIPNLCKVMNKS